MSVFVGWQGRCIQCGWEDPFIGPDFEEAKGEARFHADTYGHDRVFVVEIKVDDKLSDL